MKQRPVIDQPIVTLEQTGHAYRARAQLAAGRCLPVFQKLLRGEVVTMSYSEMNTSKLKFSVDSILGNNDASPVDEARPQEPPCAGCVAALYRCCRDEPMLQLRLPLSYSHLHPALRPTTGR